jgi:hypothetical protein
MYIYIYIYIYIHTYIHTYQIHFILCTDKYDELHFLLTVHLPQCLLLQITRQHGYILSTGNSMMWFRSRYAWCGGGYTWFGGGHILLYIACVRVRDWVTV